LTQKIRSADLCSLSLGSKDNTVPWAITNASFKLQERNGGVTEIKEIPNREHGLTIDKGWREVECPPPTELRVPQNNS
jgi:hypothetical protein